MFYIIFSAAFLALFTFFFLTIEAEWQILGLLIATAIVYFWFDRLEIGKKTKQAFLSNRVLSMLSLWIALAAVVIALSSYHFPLLMLATVALYITICLGLTVQLGFAGLTNFAGAAFFGIGGYTVAVTTAYGLADVAALAGAGCISAIIGSILILPILRTRGHYAALVTIAFGILFKTFLEVNEYFGGPQGLKVSGFQLLGWDFNSDVWMGVSVSPYFHYTLLSIFLATIMFLLVKRVERSWLGVSLDATRLDELSAQCFGINTARWKIFAFTLGNFIIGMAGGVYAMMVGHIAPTSFTFGDSLLMISIVILGGIGNPMGVIPAAFLVVVLPEKLQVLQEYRLWLFAIVVVLILVYSPSGLFARGVRSYFGGQELKK